jgi:hypothetical protein
MNITPQKTGRSVKRNHRKDEVLQIFIRNRLAIKKSAAHADDKKEWMQSHRISPGNKKSHFMTKFILHNSKIGIVIKSNKEMFA